MQGWLLGNWLSGQKDLKATIQEVLQLLTDGVIVPESGRALPNQLALPTFELSAMSQCNVLGLQCVHRMHDRSASCLAEPTA